MVEGFGAKKPNEHGDRFPPALWLVLDKMPTSVRAEKREDPDNAGSSEQLQVTKLKFEVQYKKSFEVQYRKPFVKYNSFKEKLTKF